MSGFSARTTKSETKIGCSFIWFELCVACQRGLAGRRPASRSQCSRWRHHGQLDRFATSGRCCKLDHNRLVSPS